MRTREPVKWIATLLILGLLTGCGGGFSRKTPPAAGKRIPQQETSEAPRDTAEENSELFAEEGEKKILPQRSAAPPQKTFIPTSLPTGSPYRPSDLSKLPTTINRADRSTMVLVPKGSYLVTDAGRIPGGPFGNKGALYPVPMPAFYIDQHEITVSQFKRLYADYDETVFTGGTPCPDCPAMGTTLEEAESYCARTGKRLPTESQWEAAGRGTRNQPYPWGKRFESDRANLSGDKDGSKGPANVGSFPTGASAFGSMDMIGNVWEWVDSGEPAIVPDPVLEKTLSDKPGETRSASIPMRSKRMGLVKGGGYRTTPKVAILSARHRVPADMRNPTFGFRCVKPHLGK